MRHLRAPLRPSMANQRRSGSNRRQWAGDRHRGCGSLWELLHRKHKQPRRARHGVGPAAALHCLLSTLFISSAFRSTDVLDFPPLNGGGGGGH